MLSTSNLSAHQAAHYYSKEDYYSQEEGVSPSRWLGKGAEKLGLKGDVDTEIFRQLLRGQTPAGENMFSRKVDPDKRRAATDFTFSAPKSVSIAALVQHDERVVKAHHQAVEKALSVLEERYAQTRVSTEMGRQRLATQNLITAVFTHGTSREVEPQLHSHCVVMNATQLDDGRWFSFSNEQAIANKKLLGQLYQNEMAHLLQQQGYQIEQKTHGQFELNGYDAELLKAFSTRRKQILSLLEQWQEDNKNPTGKNGKAIQSEMLLREAANLKTRKQKPKITNPERLLKGWQVFIQLKRFTLPELPSPAVAISHTIRDQQSEIRSETIDHAIHHCGEREAVFKQTHLERFVFEHHLGSQSWDELQQSIASNPELIRVEPQKYTTQAALNLELNTIRLMQHGQGQVNQIASLAEIHKYLNDKPLTHEQRKAIESTCTTADQIIAWQGSAGSGKTYGLNALKKIAQAQGYQVRGFAPSAETAHELGQSLEIETETVAALLVSQSKPEVNQKALWIVDEAGLLSMKDAHALLNRAQEEQARVVLVGDPKQLSAVEAGNPFKSLQAGGMTTVYLDTILRQKTRELRTAVQHISQGQISQGLDVLEQAGSIKESNNVALRRTQIAQDYLSLSSEERDKTLILAGTNQERIELTQAIRAGLQEEKALGPDAFEMISLRRKNITQVQARYVTAYKPGDVLVPTQNYKKQRLFKNQQYTVISTDRTSQRLVVQTPEQQLITLDPTKYERKSVYAAEPIQIAVGDQLRWTKNNRPAGIRNGQMFTINQLSSTGVAQVTDQAGKVSTIDLRGKQYIDYGWVSTTYSSQGKTADRLLALMDETTNRESFYVTVSRAKHHLTLYTADKAALIQQAQKSRAKENVSDYIPLLKVVINHAQTQKANSSPITIGRAIERGVRERLREMLATDEKRDPIATTVNQPSIRQSGIAEPDPAPEPAYRRSIASNSNDNRGFTSLAEALEQHLEPMAQAIRNYHEQQALSGCPGNLTAAIESLNLGLKQLEQAAQNRTDLAAAINRLDSAIPEQVEQHQSEELAEVPVTDQSKSKQLNYINLWQRYSQDISARNPVQFDYLVGHRAFEAGLSQKEIALMLAAGSSVVQEIKDSSGKQQALHYVNQTARKVCTQRQIGSPAHSTHKQLELE